MTPTVSIIVPNYNHAVFLEQRLDSILNQSYKDWELIILDDFSTDHSKSVIEKYRNLKNTQIHYNEANSGSVFRQWNKGFGLSKGKYVWIAESDDYADPKMLQTLVEMMEHDDDIGLAYCDSFQVKGDEIRTARDLWYHEFAGRHSNDFVSHGNDFVAQEMILHSCIPNASAVVFRRSVMQKSGTADESLKLSGDWAFWVSLLAHCKLAYTATPLNYFRTHDQTVRKNTFTNGVYLEEAYVVTKRILENFPVPLETKQKAVRTLSLQFVYMMSDNSLDIPYNRRKALRRLANDLDPFATIRLFYWTSGMHWLWLGFRRRGLSILETLGILRAKSTNKLG